MKTAGITNKIEIFTGHGKETIRMFRGNFDIKDTVIDKCRAPEDYILTCSEKNGLTYISGKSLDESVNRTWIRIEADAGEHITGGGEQFSCLDLRGRKFPIWTREQGVGRNKHTMVTRLADAAENAGGDYHTTFFPQPTFISSDMYFVHLDNFEYSVLNFTNNNYHEIELWSSSFTLIIGEGNNYGELLYKLTELLGRQKALPSWAVRGVWLGAQGGTDFVMEVLNKCRGGGIEIPAVWIQDWEGKRVTSFGKRLQWDWRWNREMYPHLDEIIREDEKTRWMGYINPYLVEGGVLFSEAAAKGYFVKNLAGEDYLFDFGEFNCGVVDLTDAGAFDWYKNVIKENLIGIGFKGWMADFGEYLPSDAVCSGGTGLEVHNKWPLLWAKCNREAVDESGLSGQIVFFMRSGAAYSGKYSTLTWAGDQCVDFSKDDGLPSVITAALSLGMSGFGLHTCDCGGYTTLFHLKRTEELMMRWLEYSCFTPIMRTHEGNRPDSNVQMYTDAEMISCAARWGKIHSALAPYMEELMKENEEKGLPVQRPLFLEDPADTEYYSRDLFEYMLGHDVLVAPVVEKNRRSRTVIFPEGTWVHMFTHEVYKGKSQAKVRAPLGTPPVFYREDSPNRELFSHISQI